MRAFGAAAIAVAAVLLVGACSEEGNAEQTSGGGSEERPKATGAPEELTAVDPEHVVGLGEERSSEDGGVAIDIAYPTVPNADPLNERLGAVTARRPTTSRRPTPGRRTSRSPGA